jgi:hypothetical protein
MGFITSFVEGKDLKFIISQTIGLIAAALLLLSFQQRTHKRIVLMQFCSGFLFALQYFLLGAYEGMVGNIVGFVRCIVYCFRGKSKFADSIACPIIFSILAGAGGLLTYTNPVSLLPMAAMMISSFVIWNPRAQELRALTIPTSLMWLIYNIICGSVSGTVTEILGQLSIYIGLFRFRNKKSGEKNSD